MSLKRRLIQDITEGGPISVADYVWRCLFDPQNGYYSTRPAIGLEGDFITSPMISQMFGEMIGLWVVATWQTIGMPPKFYLAEVGGGDGTLHVDIINVLRKFSACMSAATSVMIEPSRKLQSLQRDKIGNIIFVETLHQIPSNAPIILIANEVLDCLPARQFIRIETGYVERRIGLNDQNDLSFGLVPTGPDFVAPYDIDINTMFEISSAQIAFTDVLAEKLLTAQGAALLIDYGHDGPAIGDTLQALYRHEKKDPLESPGEHDLTQWADFLNVKNTAKLAGLTTSEIISQSQFLKNMGIVERCDALKQKNPNQADLLERQLKRLIAPDEMGTLFKALALTTHNCSPIVGFEK